MALSWGHIQLSVRVRRLWGYCIRCKRRIYVVYAAALLRGESSHALADELLPASSNKGALPCDEDTIKDIPGVHYPATGYRRISVANQKKSSSFQRLFRPDHDSLPESHSKKDENSRKLDE